MNVKLDVKNAIAESLNENDQSTLYAYPWEVVNIELISS